MTIAVDFDGVIHSYERGWQDGKIYGTLMPGADMALRQLMRHEATFVFTARDDLRAVASWISNQTDIDTAVEPAGARPVKFWNDQTKLLVTNRKLPANWYVDDKAMRFTSWGQTMSTLGYTNPPGAAAPAAPDVVGDAAPALSAALRYIKDHGGARLAQAVTVRYTDSGVVVAVEESRDHLADRVWETLIKQFKAAGWGFSTELDHDTMKPITVRFNHPIGLSRVWRR